jgi:hypothetical protein
MNLAEFLKGRFQDSYDFLINSLTGVDDTMLHWEPAPGSWGLRNREGIWIPDYDKPHPIAPGPKTIAWLIAHIASCKEMYFDYAFGPAQKRWEDLKIPGDIEGLRIYLNDSQRPLKEKLEEIDDSELENVVLTNWGDKKPVWWIYWIMFSHDIEHGGQIFHIKREYQNRHANN